MTGTYQSTTSTTTNTAPHHSFTTSVFHLVMLCEKHEGWMDILGEQNMEWLPKFCVVDNGLNTIQMYQDEQSYFDHIDPLFVKPEIARQREAWEHIQREAAKGKRRSQSLVPSSSSSPLLPSRKLTDLSRKIAQGLRSYRTRSVSYYDEADEPPADRSIRSLSQGHLQISRSQESLLHAAARQTNDTMESLDMSVSGKVTVRPIHPSILHRQHCFQVTSPHEVKYFSCRSAQELNKWVNSIKRSLQPSRDQQNRTDVSMNVWMFEAKGIATKPKKQYYCELLLDKMLYARTTKKAKSDSLFWGEHFSFEDLPNLSTITVNIYKDSEQKTPNKKEKRKLVGTVSIPAESLDTNQEVEKWYPVAMGTSKGSSLEGASIRLKIRYQKIKILPLAAYTEMLTYLSNNYKLLCETLESSVSSKVKDEIAGVILRVLQPIGKAQEFLVSIVMDEVNSLAIGEENLVFRGNSFATKAMDTYMKMVGETYLQQTLGDFVMSVYEMSEECEVDPSKVDTGNIQSNQENLKAFAEKAWNHILCSSCIFPSDLQEVFHQFRQLCVSPDNDVSSKLISASIFLRFLCPAIMSPSLFHLVQEYPNEKTLRTLTLIAKVIQNLANFTQFGGKEEHMRFMNGFVEHEFDKMREFVHIISSPAGGKGNRFEGSIDHGRELALLYTILKDQLSKLNKESLNKLRRLQFVLRSLEDLHIEAERSLPEVEPSTGGGRRWASSSDLVGDQEREKIALTPVTQMRLTKTQTKALQSSAPAEIWKKSVKRSTRALPTPQHLIVSPEDILASSPYDFDSRRYSLPITRGEAEEGDLSSTTTSGTLRRYSYLNAVNRDEAEITERKYLDSSQSPRKRSDKSTAHENGDVTHSYEALATQQTRLAVQRDLSLSFSNLETPSKPTRRQRPWSMLLESSDGYKIPGSPKFVRPHTPPVITDHSRSTLGTSIPQGSSTTSSLAIIDSIKRVHHIDRDTEGLSPMSSPIVRRKSPNQSPRFFRLHKEPSEILSRVARTPSATSSSSSESSGSLQSSSFGSGGTDLSTKDKIRKKLTSIHPDAPRRGSGKRIFSAWQMRFAAVSSRANASMAVTMPPPVSSTAGSDRVLSRVDDDFRDENLNTSTSQKTGHQAVDDLAQELAETKRALASTHEQLILQESSTHKLVASFKERLAESELSLKKTREEKDEEVKELLDRLLGIENELAKERKEMQEVVQAKQRIIEAQERRIRSLDTTNARLVATLNQMRNKQDRNLTNMSVIDSD